MIKKDSNCVDCFKIVCAKCKWIPTEREVEEIQKNILQKCPDCGWIPGRDA